MCLILAVTWDGISTRELRSCYTNLFFQGSVFLPFAYIWGFSAECWQSFNACLRNLFISLLFESPGDSMAFLLAAYCLLECKRNALKLIWEYISSCTEESWSTDSSVYLFSQEISWIALVKMNNSSKLTMYHSASYISWDGFGTSSHFISGLLAYHRDCI